MQNTIISNRCIHGLLKLIDQERHGETVDRSLMRNLIRMLIDLHVSTIAQLTELTADGHVSRFQLYKKDFEPVFLQSTEQLYHNEGRQLIQTLDLSLYLTHIERRLREEQQRVANYIDQSTK